MSLSFDPQQTLQSQAVLGATLAQIALQHAQKSFGLVTKAVDESLTEGQQRLDSASQLSVPTGTEALASLVSAGAKAVERQIQLGQALWSAGIETVQASSDAVREHAQIAMPRKATKAR